MNILGININKISKVALLNKIKNNLNTNDQHYIVTPNPEIILKAQKNEELFFILNNASFSIADGFGVKIAGWFIGTNTPRITGADLINDILKIAENNKTDIIFSILKNGLSNKYDIKNTINKLYPNLKFEVLIYNKKIPIISNQNNKILISTLGAPRQEIHNYHILKKNKHIKLAIGVGGSLDYLTKKARRAPKLLRALGLEWLWRVSLYPKRYKRIINALIIFPIQFIKWRFIKPHLYRPNVVCVLYKKENNNYKVLITERRNEHGCWQLPQGGTDGEDLIKAGTRELTEEIGTNKFSPALKSKNIHKYKFSSPNSHNIKYGYKGQKQGLFIAKFIGTDKDINICPYEHQNWKWVEASNLINEVEEVRRPGTQKYLNILNNYLLKKK